MKRQHGFTVTELIITIAIAGILAAAAVPSFRGMVRDNRLTTATNTLIAHLALARSEAVKRQGTVVLCRTGDPAAIPPVCGGGAASDWSTGWILFVDGNDNPADFNAGAGDLLVKLGEGVTGELAILSNAAATANVQYLANGASNTAARFALCDARGEERGRQVNVTTLGRTELDKGSVATPISDCTNPF